MLKKCDTCKYAIFKYNNQYRISSIYCRKLNGNLNKSSYQNLKFCNFYQRSGELE
ncbi:MAG: hypothetical protein Q4D02_06980 [Clostridia bacterium]|nr:hypothetical protein [Clostridia bacterium]